MHRCVHLFCKLIYRALRIGFTQMVGKLIFHNFFSMQRINQFQSSYRGQIGLAQSSFLSCCWTCGSESSGTETWDDPLPLLPSSRLPPDRTTRGLRGSPGVRGSRLVSKRKTLKGRHRVRGWVRFGGRSVGLVWSYYSTLHNIQENRIDTRKTQGCVGSCLPASNPSHTSPIFAAI